MVPGQRHSRSAPSHEQHRDPRYQRSRSTRWPGSARPGTCPPLRSARVRRPPGATEVLSGMLSPARQTSLLGPVSTMALPRGARVTDRHPRDICEAFDVTLNDVALAAITAGSARCCSAAARSPVESLRTWSPVSMRTRADPIARSDRTTRCRSCCRCCRWTGPTWLGPVAHRAPADDPSQVQRPEAGRQFGARRGGRHPVPADGLDGADPDPDAAARVVTLATNVPGPREQLKMLGHKVIQMYPIPPIALQLRIGIGMLSYGRRIHVRNRRRLRQCPGTSTC